MNQNDNSKINVGFPLSPENRKKYQEGVDYKIEDKGGGFKKYIILSEKLLADFRRFNRGQDLGNNNIVTEQSGKVLSENPEKLVRQIKEEIEKHRQKFIAENNPPNFQKTYIPLFDANDPKDLHN
ncbi:9128_t:CDS:1 [Paraglomus brasilianum]|uniref:9128_t:CDS:1 n=1 Tax=Paraglomus brasilianum TaxID=144538 RepID=A0A9N9E018_9GLOM|nr:9128_t:CDS:1 [Paraglomus brasilianum]